MDRRGGRVERVLGTLYRSSGSIRPRAHGQSLEISRRRKSRRTGMVEDTERDGEKRRFGRFGRRRLPARRSSLFFTLRRRSARSGEGAHAVLEEPTRREKSVGASTRRPMTSSELFASLESFSRQKSCSIFLSLPVSLSLSFFASSDFFFYSFRPLYQTHAGSRIQENRTFDRVGAYSSESLLDCDLVERESVYPGTTPAIRQKRE